MIKCIHLICMQMLTQRERESMNRKITITESEGKASFSTLLDNHFPLDLSMIFVFKLVYIAIPNLSYFQNQLTFLTKWH